MLLRYIWQHIYRNAIKSLLVFTLACLMILSIGQFAAVIKSDNNRIKHFYNDIETTGHVLSKNGAVSGLKIPFSSVEGIISSGYVSEYYVELKSDIFYAEPYISPDLGSIYAFNCLRRFEPVQTKKMQVTFAQGYDEFLFKKSGFHCVMSAIQMEELGLEYGDSVRVYTNYGSNKVDLQTDGITLEIVGSYDFPSGVPSYFGTQSLLAPEKAMRKAGRNFFKGATYDVNYCYVKADFIFDRAKNHMLPKLSAFAENYFSTSLDNKETMLSLKINDEELNAVVKPLEQNVALLERLFPVAVAVACLLGGGIPGLIIIQSAKEAAVMRILGTTKRRTRLTLVLEQLSLCLLGLLLGSSVLLMLHDAALAPVLPKLALCAGLYLGACLLATTLCATIVTRGKALDLLQTKE